MTFEEWRSCAVYHDDIRTALTAHADYYDEPQAGWLYPGDLVIEQIDGAPCLTIGNAQHRAELRELERDLFDFATSEGIINS